MSARKRFSSTWIPWVLLAVVLVVAFVVGGRSTVQPNLAERTLTVAETLRCPECTDKSMASSDAPTSVASRNEIRRQLEAGKTPDQIRAWFAGRYGDDILLTPSRRGVEGLIWAIPVVAFVIAAAVLIAAFLRWRRVGTDPVTEADRRRVEAARAASDGTHASEDRR